MSRPDDLFSAAWNPTKFSFWSIQLHYMALEEGMSADEAEALSEEYQMVQAGHRDVLGHPCLCGQIEKFRQAVRGGFGGHHDGMGSVVALRVDLAHGADVLPVRWRETERIFIAQGRGDQWRTKMGLAITGRKYRAEDFMPDLGRQHAWAWAAASLGWPGTCRWPRRSMVGVSPRTGTREPVEEVAA